MLNRLFKWQQDLAHQIVESPRGLVVWQGMGQGKTLAAIFAGHLEMTKQGGHVRKCSALVDRVVLKHSFEVALKTFYVDWKFESALRDWKQRWSVKTVQTVTRDFDVQPPAEESPFTLGACQATRRVY